MTPEQFFQRYQWDFIAATNGTKLFPSVKAAQAALETGYGSHIPANNMFGIKAQGAKTPYWDGSGTMATTREVINGQSVTINDAFRRYPTMADSIRDHSYFLMTNQRYAPVFAATTPEDQARALQSAGYATDPGYASALISIINKYDLRSLDKKKRS